MLQLLLHEIVVAYQDDYMVSPNEEIDEDSSTEEPEEPTAADTVFIHPSFVLPLRSSTKHTRSTPNNFLCVNIIYVFVLANCSGRRAFTS
jgi:hypothetical protein